MAGTSSSRRARQTLLDQLRVGSLEGFGLERRQAAVARPARCVRYLRDTQKADLAHVRTHPAQAGGGLPADRSDDAQASRGRGVDGRRPAGIAARTRSIGRSRAMGGRLLRVVAAPAAGRARARFAIGSTRSRSSRSARPIAARCARRSKAVQDLERLTSRVALVDAPGPRDLVGLRQSLAAVPRVRAAARASARRRWSRSLRRRARRAGRRARVDRGGHQDEPPALARDGGFIRDGVDPELDELRHISRSGKQVIAEMEERERARTGISSLKVRFNRVFGYYIEVSKSNLHAVPADYHRKQTIAGGERFITPALKEYEEKVLGADERIVERELELFEALRQRVAAEAPRGPRHRARAGRRSTCSPALAETATLVQLHQAARPRRRRARGASTCAIRSSSGWPRGAFVPNDVELERHRRISW